MAWVIYHQFKLKQENGNALDLDTDVIKMALLTNAYTPTDATDALFSGISANEVSGTNYTAGGTTVTATVNLATGTVTFDCNDITWSQHASGFTNARYAVLYGSVSSKLICYANFGADKGNQAGDFTVAIDAAGVFTKA